MCFDKGLGVTLDEDECHSEEDVVQKAVSLA